MLILHTRTSEYLSRVGGSTPSEGLILASTMSRSCKSHFLKWSSFITCSRVGMIGRLIFKMYGPNFPHKCMPFSGMDLSRKLFDGVFIHLFSDFNGAE